MPNSYFYTVIIPYFIIFVWYTDGILGMKKTLKKTYTEKRPWGSFTQFIKNEAATVKIISVKPKQSLSLQYHHDREEFWYVLSGTGSVVVGKKTYKAIPGKMFTVPPETLHRISAVTALEILEIATGHFDETDIVRVEDKYGRTKTTVTKKKKA